MNTENEKGSRCNCPACDGRPHLPCEAIAELDELREKLREADVKSSFDDVAFERRGEIIKDLEKKLATARSLVFDDKINDGDLDFIKWQCRKEIEGEAE